MMPRVPVDGRLLRKVARVARAEGMTVEAFVADALRLMVDASATFTIDGAVMREMVTLRTAPSEAETLEPVWNGAKGRAGASLSSAGGHSSLHGLG